MRRATDGLELRMERVLPAVPPAVFRAFTEPALLARWWGPRGFSTPAAELHPVVGGSYRITMQPPEGEPFQLAGEFLEVDRPARLSYTFRWFPPDPQDRETVVELSFEDRGESTRVLLVHTGFSTEERRALHETGWAESFDRLAEALGGSTS